MFGETGDVSDVDTAREWIEAAQRVTVVTGAGISTDSGIPDFRGPNGLWTKNPAAEKSATLQHYLADPEVRRFAWQNRLALTGVGRSARTRGIERSSNCSAAAPCRPSSPRNVDELHQRAGIEPTKVIEVHGTMWWTRCWGCNDRRPMREALDRVAAGDDDPACLLCSGVLKSDTISFGQSLVPDVIDAAMVAAERCDLLLAAGSTLSVYPAANVVPRAKTAGARVIIVNGDPTNMDRFADAVLIGRLGDLLPQLLPAREPVAESRLAE